MKNKNLKEIKFDFKIPLDYETSEETMKIILDKIFGKIMSIVTVMVNYEVCWFHFNKKETVH